jgi:hypothetical protein
LVIQVKALSSRYHPPYGASDESKVKLMGFGSDDFMYNMDICVQAAYDSSPGIRGQVPRLKRPDKIEYLRRRK